MAKIDRLLEMMSARSVGSAQLASDSSVQIISRDGKRDGPYLTAAQLNELLAEIVPASFAATFQHRGSFQFVHQSPHGAFNIEVAHLAGVLQAKISPARPETKPEAVALVPLSNHPVPPSAPPTAPPTAPPPYTPQQPPGLGTQQQFPTPTAYPPQNPYQQGHYQQPQPPQYPPQQPVPYQQPIPHYPAQPYYPAQPTVSHRSKVVGGLLGIFLGGLGIHRFYLGYTTGGIIYLLCTLVLSIPTCGITAYVACFCGFIEGIIILCGGLKDAEGRELAA